MILPLIFLLLGVGGGVGAGLILTPKLDEVAVDPCGDTSEEPFDVTHEKMETTESAPLDEREYARMNNQFVVPIVVGERVTALIVMSLSIEVETGGQEAVFSHEPRLRDAFLQVMFDHANIGGFAGAFTSSSNMRLLREALQGAADDVMQGHITDVLIVDIVRQDVTN
ncbi:flagellar basal body-associated FliL family protein [Octadecabacter sp. CECT 8868]|uniref:flagellar basal body-associated FliL family protein n=1 Tax=Octadecabacter algicola TaxID=2909342 RepID=UPI001F1B500C|nr:flagellar basal body-associated FliL family protein [Octadecabacter algicola]MCF2905963.1 flagellar basal body-associated FliL family protein [Octadecabacter algicola]